MFTRPKIRLTSKTLSIALIVMLLGITTTVAFAFTQSNFISFTLEGCRNNGTITLPIAGKFICPDAAYTTGNLGKGWNELDLVPHRLTTSAGNQGGVTTDYSVYIAADYQTNGHLGYDVISVPEVNTAKSDASCSVSPVGGQLTQGSASSPFGGGTDIVIFRELSIHQAPGTTCVFDYYQRLALGAHLYPGSSLQSYMFPQTGLSGSKKTISIPVNQILPQSLSKDMTATQGTDHVWTLTKSPSPATVSFGNTCDASAPKDAAVSIKVSWTMGPADPSGPITVITHVYATNPAARVITTVVTDKIYSGTTLLDTSPTATVNVPANTTVLVLTHTFLAPSGTTNLNDIATATYTDLVTGIPVPGTTTATASAPVQLSGTELNKSATINDVESITGASLLFSADSFTPAIGSFDGGYVAGTHTVGPVSWTSTSQTTSGDVTFAKTVYVTQASQTSGKLSDTATLTGSDGASATASGEINISADARVSLTINKTIPNILQTGESQTFTFHVFNSASIEVATPTITFGAGETSKSVTVDGLAPGTYTVKEDPVTGWEAQADQTVAINLPDCSGSVTFTNTAVPASASVKKVSVPAGFEAGWTFDLYQGATKLESVTSTGTGALPFNTKLGEGSYSIVEQSQPGWLSDGGKDCTFSVNLPADAGKVFACTFTNTYQPSVKLVKSGAELSKIGDKVDYHFTVTNTSPTAGAAGAPNLVCTVSDSITGYTSGPLTLAPQAFTTVDQLGFTIPAGALDPFVNNASVSCTYPGGLTAVASNTATWNTNLFQPSLTFDKAADTTLTMVGNVVNYTLTLTNTSSADSPNLVCTITDSMLGVNKPVTLASGAPADVTNVAYTVPVGAADPLENTASVTCSPAGFPNVLSGSDTWTVNLFQPGIKVTKTGPAFSKAGDVATFNVTIENTSSADTPALVLSSFTDSVVSGVVPPAACSPLASGASCSFSYTYTVQAGDPDPLKNTATAVYYPTGYASNTVTASSTWTTDLLHPSFTVTKVCKANTEPIPQAGPAVFTITFNNTGDADLHAVPSEGAAFDVAAGGTYSYDVSIPGPFTDTVNNNVTGTVTLAGKYALSNSYTFSASGSCIVEGKAKVIKTVNGVVPAAGQIFTFELRTGANNISTGTILETKQTDPNGLISFTTSLVPGQIYQLCEWVMPGWNTNLGPNLFVPGSMLTPTLPNPNVNNMTVCTDFTVQSGQTLTFTVDNTPPPGGRALTIGFWKNWASCANSNGKGQKPVLDQTLAVATGLTANPPAGLVVSAQTAGNGWPNFGPTYYLVLKGDTSNPDVAPSCAAAVNLLNKSTITKGTKMASDPLFNMAAQLIGAQLNYFAGAGKNGPTTLNIQSAVLLLGKYSFNGDTYSPKLTKADSSMATCLATQLDNYNNDRTVTQCK